jgi:hypothetical protein
MAANIRFGPPKAVNRRLGTKERLRLKTAASKSVKVCFPYPSKQEGPAWGPLAVIDDALSLS